MVEISVKDKGKAPLLSCMSNRRVVVILGSERDHTFAAPIKSLLDQFGVLCEVRVASAHKDSERLLRMLQDYENLDDKIVYITVAGMSNALSGFVDFKTKHPVIACPPQSAGVWDVDIYSSLRMPRGVAPLVCCDPENAAIAAVKILGECEKELAGKIREYQRQMQLKNENADERIRQGGFN
jgi:5-(carboxyamino)imidazole ribonucleotide mutase